MRHLYKTLERKDLRAINVFVRQGGEIVVGVVLAPKAPLHVETYVEAHLDQGHPQKMTLDEFIAASLKTQEVYIGIAAKIFPAVKP